MKKLILFSAGWRNGGTQSVIDQITQFAKIGGGDVQIISDVSDHENYFKAYQDARQINIATRNNYAMVFIHDDNSVFIYYGHEANREEDCLPTEDIFLSDQVVASIEGGQKHFNQRSAEFDDSVNNLLNDFIENAVEIDDPNRIAVAICDRDEIAVGKLNNLVNIDWNRQYGRRPNSIVEIRKVLGSGLSDFKKVKNAVKEMNKTWSKELKSYYNAFQYGYENGDYDSFDEKVSELSNLIRNTGYDLYDKL